MNINGVDYRLFSEGSKGLIKIFLKSKNWISSCWKMWIMWKFLKKCIKCIKCPNRSSKNLNCNRQRLNVVSLKASRSKFNGFDTEKIEIATCWNKRLNNLRQFSWGKCLYSWEMFGQSVYKKNWNTIVKINRRNIFTAFL